MKHIAKKRFGQNFLTDQGIITSLINEIAPQPDDIMVEIGPGLGAMTKPLLQKLKHLHVVEVDRDIISWMEKEYANFGIEIHNADALKFSFSSLITNNSLKPEMDARQQGANDETVQMVRREMSDDANTAGTLGFKKLRVVGNLPYNISTPILFHLLDNVSHITDMHFMLQKEVVERMVAAPSTPAYGRLSVMLQYRLTMDYLLTVPPESFDPAPKVESAFVRCVPHSSLPYAATDETLFAQIVTASFGQRRKTLRNTLKGFLDDDGFNTLAIDSQLRAENLHVADFVRIANYLAQAQ